MSYFANSVKAGDKIFRGAYTFTRNTNVYCEEEFEVFRDKREMTHTFTSEQISRVSTGELLTISCIYKINKSFIPISVTVHRSLGTQTVVEDYYYDRIQTKLNYTFDNGTDKKSISISTSPLFTIATSAACTSMIYLRSKKVDTSGKNYFSLLTSSNMWEYEKEPEFKNIAVQKLTTTTENITIDGHTVSATQYKLMEDRPNEEASSKDKFVAPQDDVRAWLSQHLAIPYAIKDDVGGTRIEIKYLTNLDKDS